MMIDTQRIARPCELAHSQLATAELENPRTGRSSKTLPINLTGSNPIFKSFSDLAQNLLELRPKGIARLRQHYLDRNSVQISDDLIGSSSTSQVFKGYLDGRAVAVKRLRMDVGRGETNAEELKELVTEIDFMCRFLRDLRKPDRPLILCIEKRIEKR